MRDQYYVTVADVMIKKYYFAAWLNSTNKELIGLFSNIMHKKGNANMVIKITSLYN